RDRNVTGVQTCALPIYQRLERASSRNRNGLVGAPGASGLADVGTRGSDGTLGRIRRLGLTLGLRRVLVRCRRTGAGQHSPEPVRSEERRVGKECSWRLA